MKKGYLVSIALIALVGVWVIPWNDIHPLMTSQSTSTYTVKDSIGHELRFSSKPQRIVSMFPSSDEVLLELVGSSRILALSRWAKDPGFSNIVDKARCIHLVAESSPEFLLKHKADLVVTRPDMGQSPEMLKTLKEMNIPVYVFKGPTNFEEIREFIAGLGRVTGERQRAEKIIAHMDKELLSVEKFMGILPPDQRKTALVWAWGRIVGGKGLMTHAILEKAQVNDGLANHTTLNGTVVSKEFIVKTNPDVIILLALESPADRKKLADELQTDPALQQVKAVKNKAIITLPMRYTSNTSQYSARAVRAIAEAVYGKKFLHENRASQAMMP